MAFGSIMLWLGIPVGWLWVGSQLQKGQPTIGLYFGTLVGIVVSMVVVGKLLYTLNGNYARVTKKDAHVRVRMPWHRSLRGETDSRPPRSILDVVMVISVSAALFLFGVWFFVFAGSSLPT